MLKKKLKLAILVSISLIVLAAVIVISWRIYLTTAYSDQIHSATENIPASKVAIIFGAAARNHQPSDVLKERLLAGIQLYEEGKVEKLLMSGDNRFSHYNEPEVMVEWVQERGVPAEDIVADFAGRRTYDTCYRARHIFQLEEAMLVTNGYHLPRSLYLCESLGMKVTGYNADKWDYPDSLERWWKFRETIATSVAWYDALLQKPAPIMGSKINIFEVE